ncbi:MAG: hypothetical protein B6U95_07615 [Thermofilum sp. ex4484_82]|nr:MAG: hypothetical protein B6U95_07615 [Thermofilum sp. ex4484_82]OYT37014.1 MAG: hypothetical protein B6U96_07610 [Archaeoglobales archaeon ex4484_92]
MSFAGSFLYKRGFFDFVTDDRSVLYLPRFFDVDKLDSWKVTPRFHEGTHLACICRADIWPRHHFKDLWLVLATYRWNRQMNIRERVLVGYARAIREETSEEERKRECTSCRKLLKDEGAKCKGERWLSGYLRVKLDEVYLLREPVLMTPELVIKLFGETSRYRGEHAWKILWNKEDRGSRVLYWKCLWLEFNRAKHRKQCLYSFQQALQNILNNIKHKPGFLITREKARSLLFELASQLERRQDILMKIRNYVKKEGHEKVRIKLEELAHLPKELVNMIL